MNFYTEILYRSANLNRQIEIYNRFNRGKINQQIDDLAVGTRFTVEVPVEYAYVS